MDSTLLYPDSLLRQLSTRFTVVINASLNSCSPLNSPRSSSGSSIKNQFDFNHQPCFEVKKSKTDKCAGAVTTAEENTYKSYHPLRDLMKRKIFTKLFRVLTLKDVTGSVRTYHQDYRARHESAKRKRARSSQSSTFSNFEPMPTIFEETESDLASVQSTIHQYTVYSINTSVNQ